jgi:drug/metabolite transporter (DMT)-like permease
LSVVVLLLIATSLWRPEWKWLDKAALSVLLIAIGLSFATRTDADREHAREASWLIPVVALATAAPWVYFAQPEARGRTLLLGVVLVVAASAFAWLRKRAR